MTLTRAAVIEGLTPALEMERAIGAAWLGGSDAFGAADGESDVDLVVDVTDGAVARAFEVVEEALERLGGISARWHVPEPTWHGHAQRFYRLHDAPETLLVDVVAMERGTTRDRFDEREAHGEPVVLFDRIGVARPRALDCTANRERMRARLEQIAARAALFAAFPEKEARRGRPLDALAFWHSMILAPLVEALRMRHCPERFSFGLRYLDRDLPEDVRERLARVAFVTGCEDVLAKAPEARSWLEEAISRARQAIGAEPGGLPDRSVHLH